MKRLEDYRDGDRISATAYRQLTGARPADASQAARFPNEKAFQNWLMARAIEEGWRYMHQWAQHAKRNALGFPDTVLAIETPRDAYECIAELKMPGAEPSPDQRAWLDLLSKARRDSRTQWVCLWYPEMAADIAGFLHCPGVLEPPGQWVVPARTGL